MYRQKKRIKRRPTRRVVTQRALVRSSRQKKRGGAWYTKFMKFGKNTDRFLRKTKLLSKGLDLAALYGIPYSKQLGTVAKTVGYGKRKRRTVRLRRKKHGKGLRLAGNGLNVSGMGMKEKSITF